MGFFRDENSLFDKKIIAAILAFHNLFWFLNENVFRTDQYKPQISWKNSSFIDSGFVKTCDELVIANTLAAGSLVRYAA